MAQTRGDVNAGYSAWVMGTKVKFNTDNGAPWKLREPYTELQADDLDEYYVWMRARVPIEASTYWAYRGQLND